jgi:hypothetical protein
MATIITDIFDKQQQVPGGALVYTNNVKYSGTTLTGGYGLSITSNLTMNQVLAKIRDEFNAQKSADEALDTRMDAAESSISSISTALSSLVSSGVDYDGADLDKVGSPSGTLNDILKAVNAEIGNMQDDIADVSIGVTDSELADTLEPLVTNYVYSGLGVLSAVGLNLTLNSGVSFISGKRITNTSTGIVLTPSMDNYVYMKQDSTLTKSVVSVGGSAPSTPADTLLLYVMSTDGTSVTSTSDRRNLYPFGGTQLPDDSIASRHIADGAVNVNNLDSDVTDRMLPSTGSSGEFIRYSGTAWVADDASVNDMNDVTLTSPASSDTLTFNGTEWVNYPFGKAAMPSTVSSASSYAATANDVIIKLDVTSSAITVTLPPPLTTSGRVFYVVPFAGDVTTHNITVNTVGGNVKGASSYVMNVAGVTGMFLSDGTNYTLIS